MKKFKKWFGFIVATLVIVLSGGGAYAMADDPAIQNPVGNLDGSGVGVAGDKTLTEGQAIMEEQLHDYDYYQTQINKHIVEMKLESCPVDQILRASSKTQKSSSIKGLKGTGAQPEKPPFEKLVKLLKANGKKT